MRYSISKIIKNKIGFKKLIIYIIIVSLSIFYIIFFKRLFLEAALMVCIFLYTLYLVIHFITEIIKINYFFKYGIETVAYVYKDNNALPFNTDFFVGIYNKILSPWKTQEIKNGVHYKYCVNGEAYESNCTFVETGDTIFLKEGTKIDVLVNPKNKNEAIIKELFIKM